MPGSLHAPRAPPPEPEPLARAEPHRPFPRSREPHTHLEEVPRAVMSACSSPPMNTHGFFRVTKK